MRERLHTIGGCNGVGKTTVFFTAWKVNDQSDFPIYAIEPCCDGPECAEDISLQR
jgi:hypothetical protein